MQTNSQKKTPPPPRHRRNSPSFSSSLLDAIYRSIDVESDSSAHLKAPQFSLTFSDLSPPPPPPPPIVRLRNADSASTFPPKPILTRSEPLQEQKTTNATKKKKKKSPSSSSSIKKRLQDLKNSTSPKLAGFLNSLFTPSSSTSKKPKLTPDSPSPSPSPSSCLSKTPSTRGSDGSRSSKRSARSVRFCPVGVIVDEDCRKCGEKLVLFDGESSAAAVRKARMMAELMRGFEMEEEDESDGSEDLFELENLGGLSAKFADELPVYETTDLRMNCAIAKGLVV